MTVEEVREAIVRHVDVHFDGSWSDLEQGTEITDIDGVRQLVVVEQVGGEDEGSHYHIVMRVVAADPAASVYFFMMEGFYSSYDGIDWDEFELKLVTPVEKTITVYEVV